ncbi:MAG TPA: maleylpyruvate isomerase N-terminal domain-containing protein [Gemmatimonadales bacterium]|nr:maleylpyruvate isomerase N-terminal domain-containing protein [Gemmatimonadales bacterium]
MAAGGLQHSSVRPVEPVYLLELFPGLHQELMRLLGGLDEADWSRPTACALWSVKDIVAHLLDTGLRRLSSGCDGFIPAPECGIASYTDLVAYLNRLNAEWVGATRRLSPPVLLALMNVMAPQVHAFFGSLDPHARAQFGVAWAGEESSPVWFDIGREYTERWLHQAQIREAVGAPGLLGREWLHPALDIFMRALPHTYHAVPVEPGQSIHFAIRGEAGGDWTLRHQAQGWSLFTGRDDHPAARVSLDQENAWRLFSKGLSPHAARQCVRIEGDPRLGEPVFGALAVMA